MHPDKTKGGTSVLESPNEGRPAAWGRGRTDLRERFRFRHLKGEDLGGGHHGEGRLITQRLGHAHSDGGLAGAGLPRQQHCSPRYFAGPDHLQDHPGSLRSSAAPAGQVSAGLRLSLYRFVSLRVC